MSDRLKLSDPAGDAELKNIVVALEQQELDQRIRQLEKNIAELQKAAADGKKSASAAAAPPNNKIGARKDSTFKAISTTPSVNKTPVGPSMVPIPYPTVQDLSNSINTARSVKFNGKPAYLLDQSTQPKGKGDEPGTGKGVKSGTVTGEVKPAQGCKTVRIEGKYVVREGDACTMNGGNNEGIFVTTIAPSGAPPRTAIETSNPPVPASPGKNWSPANPLGLPEPSSVADKVAAMLRKDALDGNAPVQRTKSLLYKKQNGPMLQSITKNDNTDPYLRTRNRLTTQLLGPLGAAGAVAELSGASEQRIEDANQIGAAAMGVIWSLSGIPSSQPISLGPRISLTLPSINPPPSRYGVKISGKTTTKYPDGIVDQATIDRIQKIPNGSRPEPSTYIPQKIIDSHLEKFHKGGSYLLPKEILDKFGRDILGRPDNAQFIMSKNEMDQLLLRAKGDISIIEKELGIPSGLWKGKEIVRIDVIDPQKLNLRMPSGNEQGANDLWIPGGKLPTGQIEAVVNSIPKGEYTESSIWK